jgi:hypothetical protein
MGEEKKKKCCGVTKFFVSLIVLAGLAWGGWFAYAKATNRPDC